MPSPEQIAKLPKWTQQYIDKLERDLASTVARCAEGPANSDTIAGPYREPPRLLGSGPTIRFQLGPDRDYIDCRVVTNHRGEKEVRVMAGDTLQILPRSSNTATLRNQS